jgi:hypothetical protein
LRSYVIGVTTYPTQEVAQTNSIQVDIRSLKTIGMEPPANITQHRKTNTVQSESRSQEPASKPCFSEIKKEANSTFEQSIDPRNRTVNIDALKSFAFQNFPKGSPIRNVLAEERSILTVPDFLAKLETWQALLRSI